MLKYAGIQAPERGVEIVVCGTSQHIGGYSVLHTAQLGYRPHRIWNLRLFDERRVKDLCWLPPSVNDVLRVGPHAWDSGEKLMVEVMDQDGFVFSLEVRAFVVEVDPDNALLTCRAMNWHLPPPPSSPSSSSSSSGPRSSTEASGDEPVGTSD